MRTYWKHLLIIGVILFSLWTLFPSYGFYKLSAEERDALSSEQRDKYLDSAIKLGLDLQGGMHLVLEIDDSKLSEDAKKDALDRAIRIIRNRVDQFGVAEPMIQKQGTRRIIVELPGLQDAQRAKDLIGKTALLEFRLVRTDEELNRVRQDLDRALKGVKVVGSEVDTTNAGSEADTTSAAETPIDTDALTEVAQSTTDQADTGGNASILDSLIPTLPGTELEVPIQDISPDAPFSSYFVTAFGGAMVADVRHKEAIDLLLATDQAKRAVPRQSELLWATETQPLDNGQTGLLLYLTKRKPILDGSSLVNASTRPNPDDPSTLNVPFTLNREGAMIFARVTSENIGRRLAIVLDAKVFSAPTIQSKIPGGEGRITGRFSDAEASDLAIVLRAGALPAPVSIIEERTVGPSLGHDSITLGVKAAMYGFIAVMLFMMIYYRASGLLACAALVLNLVLVLAVLARLHAALTLPGMAGLILTIGMAVDANVLIFERIREELAKAKTVRSAIDSGYNRAFTTILDANITTLITAAVLYQFGTGPIKGFASVLSIGIIASMFTALVCTRVVFDLLTSQRQVRKLSI